MQKRTGVLFISKSSSRVFLVWEGKWTVPTFIRQSSVIEDSKDLIQKYNIEHAKFVPIELYTSRDNGFEYGTYIVLTEDDFAPPSSTYCWADLNELPKNVHIGLKNTLSNKITQVKIDTVLATGKSYDID